jgi:hypothetical protein
MEHVCSQEVYYCTTTFTNTFSVYPAKKFPGMQSEFAVLVIVWVEANVDIEATDLSSSFAEQGLKIRVRKETRSELG